MDLNHFTDLRHVAILGALVAMTAGCASFEPLPVVDSVDLERYAGTWYEVASFPQSFQEGCTDTTATYSIRPDGAVDVLNQCIRHGEPHSAKGTARVTDPSTNAKLEVSFFWPFWGAYWIVDLGEDYDFAVVGHPSRDYLWLLSRSPELDDDKQSDILKRLEAHGFDVSRLRNTKHTLRADQTRLSASNKGPIARGKEHHE